MTDRKCNKCKKVKHISGFTGNGFKPDGSIRYRSYCKSCRSIEDKKYRNKPETIQHQREYAKNYYLRTKEARKQIRTNFAKRWSSHNKERCCQNACNWRKNNPIKTRENYRRQSRKKLATIKGRISLAMANAIRRKIRGIKLRKHWENVVGYSYSELKRHLENLFLEGMSWDNYGKWHIDHIIPISFFRYESFEDVEFKMCWRLENLQPLWARENIQKRNKILRTAV